MRKYLSVLSVVLLALSGSYVGAQTILWEGLEAQLKSFLKKK